jgi:hypothetical protein
MSVCVHEQEILTFEQVLMLFHSKFKMPIYMKVVSLNKLDNFNKGRFFSVQVNFGERSKSSEIHLWVLGFKWGLTKTLTMGWPHMCVH